MDREEAVTVIARAVHETIRASQAALGEKEAPSWPEAGWMQASSREAVEFALGNSTPGAQHEAWMAEKRRGGWSYGSEKSEAKKTHPSMVPFGELPESERQKDEVLIAVVKALAPVLGVERRRG
jgi:hypothetical protein